MDTHYYIQLTMPTDRGPEPYGRFDLGEDRGTALAIWDQLDGNAETLVAPIQVEWIEAERSLPMDVRVKCCTLQQLASNCALITREVFKANNLSPKKEMED